MKHSHKILIIAILACLLVCCLVFASCNLFHTHTYGDKWYYNETYHWQVCSSCKQDSEKGKHTVDESSWRIFKEPTETETGLRRGKCSVCNKTIEEEIARLDHAHNFAGDYFADELGHWQTCSCGEKNVSAHVVTNWIVDVPATATAQGQRHGECDVCHNRVDGTIAPLDHTHSYANSLSYDEAYHYRECSCGDKIEIVAHSYSDNWKTDDTNHWKECVCGRVEGEETHIGKWVVDTPATTTSTGIKSEVCARCGKTLRTETIDKLTSSTRTVDFYAINDFHGEVDKISTVGGHLKQQKNSNPNTVLLNSGDMFQGSMESNSNYGKLLTDCMDRIGFDAFTFGNHEFDWGLTKLEALAQSSVVPFLGANIYHWNASTKTWGDFASELAQKYTTVTLDNGLKIGIIGVIGKDQITSISSNLVQTIGFKDPLPIIKELADELREEQQCDVVVVSAHAGPQSLVGESEDNQQPSSAAGLEQYVDAVFCAHTHRYQSYVVDGIPFIQGGSYGGYVSHVTLSVDSNGNVGCITRENIRYSSKWPNVLVINDLIDNSNEKIKDERNQVLATISSSLNKNPAMARLVSRSIVEYAANQGYNVALAMVNTARQDLAQGEITYSKLYESIPFDNEVYIAKVKGSEIISEVNYGNYYWRSSGEAIESNKYYYIAVIDYLLFHQNSNRNYNYFPSAFTSGFTPVALTNDNYEVYNYRLITRDYLLSNTINPSDYLIDNNNTDTTLLQNSVTLTYETVGSWNGSQSNPMPTPSPSKTTHAGTLDDPYDVADALLLGADYDNGSQAPKIYVKVIVSDVSAIRTSLFSDDIGGFYVSDENGNSIKVYYVSKSNNSNNNWTSTDELKVGDVLVMYVASYVYYYNGATPQLGYGYCLSINGNPT